jgi:hypothetical protein
MMYFCYSIIYLLKLFQIFIIEHLFIVSKNKLLLAVYQSLNKKNNILHMEFILFLNSILYGKYQYRRNKITNYLYK